MEKLKFPRLPNFRTLFRAHFVSGLLILIPLGVILWMLSGFMRFLWSLQELLPYSLREGVLGEGHPLAFLLKFALTAVLAIALAFIISLLGWVSQQYLGQSCLRRSRM